MTARRTVVVGLVLLVGVAEPLTADPAEASRARTPVIGLRPKVAWPIAARHEAAFVADINRLRASRGLPALQVRAGLTRKARRWAATMAAARRIWHSRLPAGITADWWKLGENVGMGASEARLHAAFVASNSHLRNLVDPAFNSVGVGVVTADGVIFVSEVFMQPAPRVNRRAGSTSRRRPAPPAGRHRLVRVSTARVTVPL